MESLLVSALMWKNVAQTDFLTITSPHKYRTYTTINSNRRSLKKFRRYRLYNQIKKQQSITKKPVTLIFAPHPDDAILCCSLEIRKRIQSNERVKVIYVTNGDGKDDQNAEDSYQYGQTRKEEARKAMKKLGLKNSDLIFLDFPDGYLAYLKDKTVSTSRFTHQNKTSKQSYYPKTDYTWLNLKNSISKLITIYKPKEIFIPHATKEQHWDHREVGRVIRFIMAKSKLVPKVFEYTVHKKYPPKITKKTNQFKLNLIDIFKSQFHDNAHQEFLENFAKIPETFDIWKKN